jgi:hypothetical protein
MTVRRFPFRFAPTYRPFAALFGVLPATAFVQLDESGLVARFGPWAVRTDLGNIVDVRLLRGFERFKTLGPARVSWVDRGLTMATNADQGVCLRFASPVPGLEPTGRLRHPGLTVTVADCTGLVAALAATGAIET